MSRTAKKSSAKSSANSIERRVAVVNELGLHARAAATLARMAGDFADCDISVRRESGGASADAKSITALLMLAAAQGTKLIVAANGGEKSEAQRAADSVADLFARGFGEDSSDAN